jgi:hypothetical protein
MELLRDEYSDEALESGAPPPLSAPPQPLIPRDKKKIRADVDNTVFAFIAHFLKIL